ncbi:MAG: sporulation protein YtfJ [Oscillospiraceae bacterium]|nr:sporulation protein YtfJ [Oscillospiraceae bacterium]
MPNDLGNIFDAALEKLKEISGSDTIVGDPIALDETTTVIPVSKVTFGFAGAGGEFGKSSKDNFGVGTGGGVSVTPIAFLVKDQAGVRLIQLVDSKSSTVDNIIRTVPEVVNKVTALFKKDETTEQE